MDLYFTSSQAVSTRQPLFYRSLLKGILLTLAISFCQIQYLAAQTNIVANGTFNTNLAGWTATGGWAWLNSPTFAGCASDFSDSQTVSASNPAVNTDVLSQSLTGLNYSTVPNHVIVKFDLKGGNVSSTFARTANIVVYLGGTAYGEVINNTTNNTLGSANYNGGILTYTPNPYNFANDVVNSSIATVTLDIPWTSQPNTAVLAFGFGSNGDDFAIDNISVMACGAQGITAINPTCAVTTGSIAVTAQVGGASYTLTPGGTVSSTGSFPGLAPSTGPYTVSYTAPGCTAPPASNAVSIGAPATGCCGAVAGTVTRQ